MDTFASLDFQTTRRERLAPRGMNEISQTGGCSNRAAGCKLKNQQAGPTSKRRMFLAHFGVMLRKSACGSNSTGRWGQGRQAALFPHCLSTTTMDQPQWISFRRDQRNNAGPADRREGITCPHAGEDIPRRVTGTARPTNTNRGLAGSQQDKGADRYSERPHKQMVSQIADSLLSSLDVRFFCGELQFERRSSRACRWPSSSVVARLGTKPPRHAPPCPRPVRHILDPYHRSAGARRLASPS